MATEPVFVEEPTRRVNPVLVGGLVVLVLALFGFFVVKPLLFPADEAEELAPPPPRSGPIAAPSPSPSPTPPPSETFDVFESKDPFRPLVVAGAPSTGGAAPSGGTSTGTSGGTTGTGGTGTSTGGGSGGSSAPSGGQRVGLLDVFTADGAEKVQVRVGSTVYTVAVGETFASSYKLLSTSGNCATFLHGDDKFTLCEGEEVLK